MNFFHTMLSYLKKQFPAILSLIFLFLFGFYLYLLSHPADDTSDFSTSYSISYEEAVVTEIISDTCEPDPAAENSMRGTQILNVTVVTGTYTGESYRIQNVVGPVYGTRLALHDSCIIALSSYEDGSVLATVYEYNRSNGIFLLLVLFFTITVLVGGKTGARSLLGLCLTVAALLLLLLPLLFLGWPTLPATLLICSLITCIVFLILSGWDKKTVCATLGTISGMLFATLFAVFAQKLLHIDGYREDYAEPLLQLRQTGEHLISIRYLLVAGVMISALGAVMDVAMSISSAVRELSLVGNHLSFRRLFSSGMHIGRDMVGTMTNTLILAVLGSSLILVLYIASLNLPLRQFLSSPYLALELASSLSSSIGVILTVPLTAFISALLYGHREAS